MGMPIRSTPPGLALGSGAASLKAVPSYLSGIGAASARIARRGERIESMDFSREGETGDLLRLARGAE